MLRHGSACAEALSLAQLREYLQLGRFDEPLALTYTCLGKAEPCESPRVHKGAEATVRIPSRLENLLTGDKSLQGSVLLSTQAFEPILKDNKMPFFPEYTDHGIEHVESVMRTADALISDGAWDQVSAADAAVLVLACLLHDIAMHLSEDGFVSLVSPSASSPTPVWKGDRPWQDLWLDFLGEASRFDGRKLVSLFGDSDPVTRPPLQPDKMTKRDRLLIGEFLRRHHHRLAHEIAIHGFPGPGDEMLRLVGTPEHIAKLAGIVARSHGISVRACIAGLEPEFDRRETYGVHPPFLMAVIRVADYVQIEKERAPRGLLKIKRLQSPISSREWAAHDSVRCMHDIHDDPEAIFIRSQPKDVKSYLRVKEWLSGIQEELDASWAVLGELYGRFDALSQLGLVIRRVRSNLDDTAVFAKTVDYVPTRAAFQTANADLLKLLIGPLYGNRAEIGVRELVQNAVDAVRELREYVKQRPELKPDVADQPADVVVLFEQDGAGNWSLTVSDKGIGMSSEIIQEYFLKAGASYRSSDAWRNRFEDREGRSRVLRSGRFGVGALATFLLGHEIEVTTRHIDAPPGGGIRFVTDLEDEAIELRKADCPVGTSIRVPISQDAAEQVENWFTDTGWRGMQMFDRDGYGLSDPSVLRSLRVSGKGEQQVEQRYALPKPGSSLDAQWHRIKHADYQDVQWTYSRAPGLACNGITVYDTRTPIAGSIDLWGKEPVSPPHLSVFDSQARLPLTLQRDSLVSTPGPFDLTLCEEVAKDLIAFMLIRGPISHKEIYRGPSGQFRYPGLISHGDFSPLLITAGGVSIPLPWHLREARLSRALLLPELDSAEFVFATPWRAWLGPDFHKTDDAPLRIGPGTAIIKFRRAYGSRELYGLLTQASVTWDTRIVDKSVRGLPTVGRRIVASDRLASRLLDEEEGSADDDLRLGEPSKITTASGLAILSWGRCRSGTKTLESVATSHMASGSQQPCAAIEWSFAKSSDWPVPENESVVERMWREIVGQAIIPYDLGERRETLAHAYRELAPYVTKQEALLEQEQRDA